MTEPRYLFATGDWRDAAAAAVAEGDGNAALQLLDALVNPSRKAHVREDGTVTISNLGLSLGTCAQCGHYAKDPDPIDPGWPMMCPIIGLDMLEPYATCWMQCPDGDGA